MARRIGFTEEELREAVSEARCVSDVLRTLGHRVAGGNHETINKYLRLWGIPTDHFDPHWATRHRNGNRRRPIEEILVERSTYSRSHLKQRLFEEELKDRVCELCGQSEIWRGGRMALIIDHINGVGNDNRLENLRIVCPNCAATFDTHCGRNNKQPPRVRNCEFCGEKFRTKYLTHRFCSVSCGRRGGPRATGVPQTHRRKVDRPSLAQLEEDLAHLSFVVVGRKYGVSDNAIRKWLVFYEREAERERREAA